jgi:hypothetical protein
MKDVKLLRKIWLVAASPDDLQMASMRRTAVKVLGFVRPERFFSGNYVSSHAEAVPEAIGVS